MSAHTLMAHALRYEKSLFPIRGEVLIGRGAHCQVVIDSERVSRRHARVSVSPEGVFLEDLDSANGVFLNGSPIAGRCALHAGDRIIIGDRTLELVSLDEPPEQDWQEERSTLIGSPEDGEDWDSKSFAGAKTGKGDTMALLGGVVERLLDEGDVASAERLMNVRTSIVLSEAERGARPSPEVELAFANLVLRLAAAVKRPSWIDFLFDYYRALGRVIPLEAVQQIYDLVRATGPFSAEKLSAYLITVSQTPQSATDRFTLQRLDALSHLGKRS
jgi:hypothetical protein